MFGKFLKYGIDEGIDSQEKQFYILTNVVCLVTSIIFLFYVFYGILIGSERTTIFAFAFLTICGAAYWFNISGHYSLSKFTIIAVSAFSVLFTYQIYTIGLAVLATYFPILLMFLFVFDFSKERSYFLSGLGFTILAISLCFLIPRHSIYQIEIPTDIVDLSNNIHIIITLIATGVLLAVAVGNKDRINRELRANRDELQSILQEFEETRNHLVQSEKMASLGLLASGINHEINNPLNFIMGSLENLKRLKKLKSADELKPYLEAMEEGVNRIDAIVKSLNHFNYKSQRDGICDIHSILDNCLIIMQHKVGKAVAIKKMYADNAIVKGISGQIHQVFLNLIANAIHSLNGSGEITIFTHFEDTNVLIEVRDNGRGIPKEIQEKIFDPFFTTKSPGEGTGLGLSISRKIIHDHDGLISVQSELEIGTTFIVSLPLHAS